MTPYNITSHDVTKNDTLQKVT